MKKSIHKKTYDSLADEYESRAESLIPITQEAVKICSKYLSPRDNILDIGCAVGLAVNIFNKEGFKCTGIELSSEMVKYARKRNPGVTIIEGDFLKEKFFKKFKGIYLSAFIHLFPKSFVGSVFKKIYKTLDTDGYIFLSTTKSKVSSEGMEEKGDYKKKEIRFRKHWTEDELELFLINHKFKIINKRIFSDPYNKTWMGFIAQKTY